MPGKFICTSNELPGVLLDFFRSARRSAPRLGFRTAMGISLDVMELSLHHLDVFVQRFQFGAEDMAFLAHLVPTSAEGYLGFVRLFDQLLKHALQYVAAPCQGQLLPLASLTHRFPFCWFPRLSPSGSTLGERDADGGK
jgi:hypothetical protein